VLAALLIFSVALSLGYGLGPAETVRAFLSHDGAGLVMRKIRLPRVILSVLVGGSLGVCGVTLQSILRNPLAEPYTLGISGGASLGITLSTLLGLSSFLGMFAAPLFGFGGAIFSVSIVYGLSSKKRFDPNSMVLFGVVVSLVFSSFVFFLFSLLDPDRMQTALMWLMGDLSSLDVALVPWYIPLFLLPVFVLFFFGKELDLLSLGSEKARYLGINPPRLYRILFIITSLLAGFCVSAAGIVSFVGLIVPHVLRGILGAGHTVLLVGSFLAGAFFLTVSDVFSRYLLYPIELPAGVVTGILGGVILLVLLVRKR
jgi:iron complex transport system permease protein